MPANPPSPASSGRERPSIERPGLADAEAVRVLALADGYAPLGYLSRFGLDVGSQIRADAALEAFGDEGVHLVARQAGLVVGALLGRPVEDLADHFQLPVHEVRDLVVDASADRQVVAGMLLAAYREEVKVATPGFVLLRLEGRDLDGVAGAADAGFRVRETSLSYVNDLERSDRNLPEPVADIRVHRFADGPLPDHMIVALRSGSTRFTDDHYHADPRLGASRCDALYDRVRDRVSAGIGADVLVSRFIDDEMVGFGTWRDRTDLSAHGVSLVDGAFGFRLPRATSGNQTPVGAYVCNNPLLDNRLLEWTTQGTNYSMVNMLSRQASIRLCRMSYVLHGWTDRP